MFKLGKNKGLFGKGLNYKQPNDSNQNCWCNPRTHGNALPPSAKYLELQKYDHSMKFVWDIFGACNYASVSDR